MKLVWSEEAWSSYLEWQVPQHKQALKRLNRLIEECRRTPTAGIGKPEGLKGDLSGWWSRRIDDEHRLVYRVHGGALEILSCRYHY